LGLPITDRSPAPRKCSARFQSNISNRIAHLEKELGTELVNRSNGLLTESGEIVVDRARRILGELRGIASDVSELNAEIHGQVVLGMIGSAGRWMCVAARGV